MGPGRLLRPLLRCCRRRAVPPPLPRGAAVRGPLSAALRLWAPQRPPGRGEPPRAGGGGRRAGGDDDDDDDEEEEEEDEDVEELLGPSPLGPVAGAQRVAVVQPAVRWGPKKPQFTTGGWAPSVPLSALIIAGHPQPRY